MIKTEPQEERCLKAFVKVWLMPQKSQQYESRVILKQQLNVIHGTVGLLCFLIKLLTLPLQSQLCLFKVKHWRLANNAGKACAKLHQSSVQKAKAKSGFSSMQRHSYIFILFDFIYFVDFHVSAVTQRDVAMKKNVLMCFVRQPLNCYSSEWNQSQIFMLL